MIIDIHAHVFNERVYEGYLKKSRGKVSKMIVLGDGNGILGADDKTKDAYFRVAKEIGLEDCFYCDSIKGRLFTLKNAIR